MQTDHFQPTRQRVLDRRNLEHIGRACQNETARNPSAIDRDLQGEKECRDSLYLIQDDPFGQIGDKAHRISLGAGAYNVVVEVYVPIVSATGGQGARWTTLPSHNAAGP